MVSSPNKTWLIFLVIKEYITDESFIMEHSKIKTFFFEKYTLQF